MYRHFSGTCPKDSNLFDVLESIWIVNVSMSISSFFFLFCSSLSYFEANACLQLFVIISCDVRVECFICIFNYIFGINFDGSASSERWFPSLSVCFFFAPRALCPSFKIFIKLTKLKFSCLRQNNIKQKCRKRKSKFSNRKSSKVKCNEVKLMYIEGQYRLHASINRFKKNYKANFSTHKPIFSIKYRYKSESIEQTMKCSVRAICG